MTAPRGGGPARSPGATGGARGAVVIGLAVILGIVGLQILDDSGNGSSGSTATTVPGTQTTDGGGSTATTAPPRQNQDVRVKVYNASGVQGRAQTLTDQLRAKGYNMQEPANLDKQRPGTVIECTTGFEREAQLLRVYGMADLPSTVEAYPSDPPAGASDADCIVVIGTA